jgi:hypothetical protein
LSCTEWNNPAGGTRSKPRARPNLSALLAHLFAGPAS